MERLHLGQSRREQHGGYQTQFVKLFVPVFVPFIVAWHSRHPWNKSHGRIMYTIKLTSPFRIGCLKNLISKALPASGPRFRERYVVRPRQSRIVSVAPFSP